MITPCKVVQMRETVSTAPRSTLLLYLDKVMLETACVRVRVCVRVSVDARWRVGARGARACIWHARSCLCAWGCLYTLTCVCEREACVCLARALFSRRVSGNQVRCLRARASACLHAFERMEELEDLRESAAEKEREGE